MTPKTMMTNCHGHLIYEIWLKTRIIFKKNNIYIKKNNNKKNNNKKNYLKKNYACANCILGNISLLLALVTQTMNFFALCKFNDCLIVNDFD